MAHNRKNRLQSQLRQGGEAPDTSSAPDAPRGEAFTLSTTVLADDLTLPVEARAELGDHLFQIARRYIGARRRSGSALLEAARALSEARHIAEEGTWHAFLRVTETSQDLAESLINIALRAQQQELFAGAIASGRVNQTVAGLLARPSTPPEVVIEVLSDDQPLRVADIQRVLRQLKQRTQLPQAPHVDNVDSPNNADSAHAHNASSHAPRSTHAPLNDEDQRYIDQLIARVDGYLADLYTLTPQDWQRLTPLAQRLHDLFERVNTDRPDGEVGEGSTRLC